MNFLNKPCSDILLQIGVLEEKKEKEKVDLQNSNHDDEGDG
jgi:hypothetical protein